MSNNPLNLSIGSVGSIPDPNHGGNQLANNPNENIPLQQADFNDPNNIPEDNLSLIEQPPQQIPLEQQVIQQNEPRGPNETAKTFSEICPCFILLTTTGFALFVMVFSVLGFYKAFGDKYVTMNDGAGVLTYASTSLRSSLLIDIALPTNGACPAGYDTITFGTWPGTNRGCDCGGGDISEGACGDSQSSCSEVYSEGAVALKVWRNIGLCGKKSASVTKTTSASCPSGYKKCYRDICVSSSSECYITDIVMRPLKGSDNLKPLEKADLGAEASVSVSLNNQTNAPANGSAQANGTTGNMTSNATSSNKTVTQDRAEMQRTQTPAPYDFWSTITSSSPDLPWTTADSPDPFAPSSWAMPSYSYSSQATVGANSPDASLNTQTSINSADSPDFSSNFGADTPDALITRSDLSADSPDARQATFAADSSGSSGGSQVADSPDLRGFSAESPYKGNRRMLVQDRTSQMSFSGSYIQTNGLAPAMNASTTSGKNSGPYETKNSNGLRDSITIDSTYQIRIFRRVGVSPITNFALTTDNLPCLASNRDPMPNSSAVYPLLKSQPTGCGKYGSDTDSMELDELKEEELYMENGMSSQIQGLPKYEDYISSNSEMLSVRPRVLLNPPTACFQLDLSDAGAISSKANSLAITNFIFLASAIFFVIVQLGLALLLFSDRWSAIASVFLTLAAGLNAGVLYAINSVMQTEQTDAEPLSGYLATLANKKCFTNNAISNAINELSSALPDYITQSLSLLSTLQTAAIAMLVCEMILLTIFGMSRKLSSY